jgi:hypothetical protein
MTAYIYQISDKPKQTYLIYYTHMDKFDIKCYWIIEVKMITEPF